MKEHKLAFHWNATHYLPVHLISVGFMRARVHVHLWMFYRLTSTHSAQQRAMAWFFKIKWKIKCNKKKDIHFTWDAVQLCWNFKWDLYTVHEKWSVLIDVLCHTNWWHCNLRHKSLVSSFFLYIYNNIDVLVASINNLEQTDQL